MSTKGKAHTGGICILAAVLLVQSLGALPFAAASTPTPTTMDADTLRSLGMSTSEIESLLFEQAGGNEKEPGESILGYENDDDLGIDADEDGVFDHFETIRYGTDPLSPDTDGDGVTDGVEIFENETDPLSTSLLRSN